MSKETIEMSNFLAESIRIEGNIEYHSGKFYEALTSLNKSLCFGKKNEIRALAYANRSAVYLRMKRYKQCLENIQLARDAGYPAIKMLSLIQREEMCRKLLEHRQFDPTEDPWNFYKLSYPPNIKIPFIVNCLELQNDQQFGRHIITNRDLKPGDVIAIEDPFFKHLEKSHCYQRCSNCLKANVLNLIPCEGPCVDTAFCSVECRNQAKSYHNQYACQTRPDKLFSQLHHAFLDAFNIAGSVKELQNLIEKSEKVTIFDFDMTNLDSPQTKVNSLKAFCGLMARSTSWIENDLKMNELLFLVRVTLRRFWRYENDVKKLLVMLLRLSRILELATSSFSSSLFMEDLKGIETSDEVMSSTISLFGSLINHSCDPNVVCIDVDNKQVTIVKWPIKAGEQLFKCYSSPFYTQTLREERRAKLFKQYQFKCNCFACFNHLKLPRELQTEFDVLNSNVSRLSLAKRENLLEDFKESCKKLEDNFSNHPCRETILSSLNFICLLKRFSTFGSLKPQSHVEVFEGKK